MKLCSMKPSLFTDILKSIIHIKKRVIFFLQFKKRICAIENKQTNIHLGNSLVVQWLGLCTAEVPHSILGWGTKIPQALWGG